MISEPTRREAWVGLLEISRTCRYYEALHTRFTFKYQVLRFVTLAAISVGLAGVLGLIPGLSTVTNPIIAAIIAVLMILESVTNYSKKAAVAHAIYFRCSQLRVDVEELWDAIGDADARDEDVRFKLRVLARTVKEVENWSGFGDFSVDQKLNERTAQDAYDYAENRYKRSSEQIT